jgi:putative membrane protein
MNLLRFKPIMQLSFKIRFMKKYLVLFGAVGVLAACNNGSTGSETSDTSTMKSDNSSATTDSVQQQSTPAQTTKTTDSASSKFLMKAADGGMAEVAAGTMAQQKATDPGVKRFASMMVEDHTGANGQVKTLSEARNISLPAEPSQEHKQKAADLEKKSGNAFDKAYMDMMVADHKKTISLFQKASGESADDEVKSFITATIPKLKMHLDSATAIRSKLSK